MNRLHRLGAAACLWLAALPLPGAFAQTSAAPTSGAAASAPRPSLAASAAPTGAPEKRSLTPAEARHSATMAGDLRPAEPVAPQITIPLDKAAPTTPKALLSPPARTKPAPSGGVDDSAARCAALADAAARDQCRAKLAR
jgi:hypothetical protein